jgi:ubiquinone/menaquinone biosynthesis C-methylase UbiE
MSDEEDSPKRYDVDPLLGLPITNLDLSGIEMATLDPSTDTTTDTTSLDSRTDSPANPDSPATPLESGSVDKSESPDNSGITTVVPDNNVTTDNPVEQTSETIDPGPASDESIGIIETKTDHSNLEEDGVITEISAADIIEKTDSDNEESSDLELQETDVVYTSRIKLPPTPAELEQAELLLASQREERLRAARAFAASTVRSHREHSANRRSRSPTRAGILESTDSFGSHGSSGSSGQSWGSLFEQSASFLSSATRAVAKSAVDISKRLGTEYEERVPEHLKEKISYSATTVVETSKVVAQKSVEIFDKNLRPTIYNSTIGHFYTSELTRLLLLEIPESSTILDVGIGTAYSYCLNASLLKERKIKVIGIDIDESYILRARHSLIDYDLEEEIELICDDVYSTDFDGRTFDYVVFSDSYAVIPNVNNMMRHCERFMKEYTGYMIVTSTLFDEYDATLDRIKQNLKYVSAIEYGQLMLKSDLETYIVDERRSDDYEFKLIKKFNIGNMEFNSYIARWRPGDVE